MEHNSLRSLSLEENYRSDRNNVVSEFYIPTLSVSVRYDRAVGYFTSGSLALFSRGLARLVDRGGKIRMIASPHLLPEDLDQIKKGYTIRQVVSQASLRALDDVDEYLGSQLGYLGRLIAAGKLDLKLAFIHRDGVTSLYHEKMGILHDGHGDAVCFTGSANETIGGLLANFESVEVYKSWDPSVQNRALRIVNDFDSMWLNQTPGLDVSEFPEVCDRVIAISQKYPNATNEEYIPEAEGPQAEKHEGQSPRIPASLELRKYQKDAIRSWFENDLRGIFSMATGTGKTKTALAAASKLSEMLEDRGNSLLVVITAPYLHLADQWLDELKYFGSRGIACYGAAHTWRNHASAAIDDMLLGRSKTIIFVVSNDTLAGTQFQSVLKRVQFPMLFIGDEAHNLGARHISQSLPVNAEYRLGLSATPERWMDPDGTARLFQYFGKPVFEMGMDKAIAADALCKYEYKPRLVPLDDEEMELYVALTTKIGALLASGADLGDDDGPLGHLLRKRAQVLGHARGKLEALRADLQSEKNAWYQLVYCAEGTHPVASSNHNGKQLDTVLHLAGKELSISTHEYIAETKRSERRRILQRFATGNDLQVLVSMKCLDEGVDIPDARIAYLLASSSNPRQFIQRRGRILRKAPGKKTARIYDYLAVPGDLDNSLFEVERRLVEREISRATEFANLSMNLGEALEILRPLKEKYELMDY